MHTKLVDFHMVMQYLHATPPSAAPLNGAEGTADDAWMQFLAMRSASPSIEGVARAINGFDEAEAVALDALMRRLQKSSETKSPYAVFSIRDMLQVVQHVKLDILALATDADAYDVDSVLTTSMIHEILKEQLVFQLWSTYALRFREAGRGGKLTARSLVLDLIRLRFPEWARTDTPDVVRPAAPRVAPDRPVRAAVA